MSHCTRSSGAGRRLLGVLAVGVAAAVVLYTFARPDRVVSPPPRNDSYARLSTRTLQVTAVERGVVFGSQAGDRELAVLRRDDPTWTQPVGLRVDGDDEPAAVAPEPSKGLPVQLRRVRSAAPHPTRERALNDALQVARDDLAARLGRLDPPVTRVPTADEIATRFLKPESVTEVQPSAEVKAEWAAAKVDANRVWVEIDVDVTADQVRQLRSADRVPKGGLLAAVGLVLVGGAFGFLRLDAWTKGYLTTVLAFGTAAAVGGAVALLAVLG